MFNPLSILLGQQLSSMVPEYNGTNDPILVNGPTSRPQAAPPVYNEAPPRAAIDPRYVLNDDRIAPGKDETKEILPREGEFGIKGTLRSVLGTVGDAFLMQAGQDPLYRNQRLREQAGDAMFGAANDPLQAAERLAAAGFVNEAQELLAETNRHEYYQGQLASQDAARRDQIDNRRRDDVRTARNQIARYFNVAGDNPSRIAFVYTQAERLARELGVPLEDLVPGPNLSSDERAVYAGGDMTVNQQEALPRRDRQLNISQQNADSARISATRPRNPPPRPRADTDQEYYRELSNVPANERTQEETDWMRMYIRGRGQTSGNSRRTVTPDGGSRTSNWSVRRN